MVEPTHLKPYLAGGLHFQEIDHQTFKKSQAYHDSTMEVPREALGESKDGMSEDVRGRKKRFPKTIGLWLIGTRVFGALKFFRSVVTSMVVSGSPKR